MSAPKVINPPPPTSPQKKNQTIFFRRNIILILISLTFSKPVLFQKGKFVQLHYSTKQKLSNNMHK